MIPALESTIEGKKVKNWPGNGGCRSSGHSKAKCIKFGAMGLFKIMAELNCFKVSTWAEFYQKRSRFDTMCQIFKYKIISLSDVEISRSQLY